MYVIACPKSELKYNEEEEKAKEQQRKMEQLQVNSVFFGMIN